MTTTKVLTFVGLWQAYKKGISSLREELNASGNVMSDLEDYLQRQEYAKLDEGVARAEAFVRIFLLFGDITNSREDDCLHDAVAASKMADSMGLGCSFSNRVFSSMMKISVKSVKVV